MKVAFDYDGTYMLYPLPYGKLMKAFRADGHTVGILTGRSGDTEVEDKRRLTDKGLAPDFFYNTSLFNSVENEIAYWIHSGQINMDRDVLNCICKARMCHENDIDILYDDAADLIRLFLVEGCETMVLKSPAPHNFVIKKWGREHSVEYEELKNEVVTT